MSPHHRFGSVSHTSAVSSALSTKVRELVARQAQLGEREAPSQQVDLVGVEAAETLLGCGSFRASSTISLISGAPAVNRKGVGRLRIWSSMTNSSSSIAAPEPDRMAFLVEDRSDLEAPPKGLDVLAERAQVDVVPPLEVADVSLALA